MRTLGQCPTQIEVQELILEVDITRRRRTGATGRGGSTKKKGRKQKKDPSNSIIYFNCMKWYRNLIKI